MRTRKYSERGIAPIIIALIALLTATVGTTAGVLYKDDIETVLTGGESTTEEQTTADQAAGKSKFELVGTVSNVNIDGNKITVKVKSGSNTISTYKNNEVTITLSSDIRIVYKDKTTPTIADIPIGAQIQVGGTITGGALTATKIEVQKEEAKESTSQTKFELNGTVKSVGNGELVITVKSTNKLTASFRGKDATVKTAANTVITKDDGQVALSEIAAGDKVHVSGVYKDNILTAAKISAESKEAEQEQEQESNQGSSSQNQNSNSNTNKNNDDEGDVRGSSIINNDQTLPW